MQEFVLSRAQSQNKLFIFEGHVKDAPEFHPHCVDNLAHKGHTNYKNLNSSLDEPSAADTNTQIRKCLKFKR